MFKEAWDHVTRFNSHHRLATAFPRSPGRSFAPDALATMYGVPDSLPGEPSPVDLIELGGGYDQATINRWCDANGYAHPEIVSIGVLGARNAYSGDPSGADGEVALDLSVVIGVHHRAWPGKPAKIRVIFAPNSDVGFQAAVDACNTDVGISWGGPEATAGAPYTTAMNSAFLSGVTNRGVVYCCASGDSGAGDGLQGRNVDFPGSSPYVLCCGGTSIVTSKVGGVDVITNESVWNHDGGAGGGGVSILFNVPPWQKGFAPAGAAGRCVPDLAANADPASGWSTPFGPIGGTSAVAPFMAAVFSIVRSLRKVAGSTPNIGLPHDILYHNEPTAFRDVVAGNNSGFGAGKGYDLASGLGAPLCDVIIKLFAGGIIMPPSPPPPPPVLVNTISLDAATAETHRRCTRLMNLNPRYANVIHEVDVVVENGLRSLVTGPGPHDVSTNDLIIYGEPLAPRFFDFAGLFRRIKAWLVEHREQALPIIDTFVEAAPWLTTLQKEAIEELIAHWLGADAVSKVPSLHG